MRRSIDLAHNMRRGILLLALSAARACPDWCGSWHCDGSAWCANGNKPGPCAACSGGGGGSCASWCAGWSCDGDWCRGGRVPPQCDGCGASAIIGVASTASEGKAVGPVASTNAGWVVDHAKNSSPRVSDGTLTVTGDTRVYLVVDHNGVTWGDHKYVRFDLHKAPLEFEADLSNVPCGCLACVYLVAMKDPSAGDSNYCGDGGAPRALLHAACTRDVDDLHSQ